MQMLNLPWCSYDKLHRFPVLVSKNQLSYLLTMITRSTFLFVCRYTHRIDRHWMRTSLEWLTIKGVGYILGSLPVHLIDELFLNLKILYSGNGPSKLIHEQIAKN